VIEPELVDEAIFSRPITTSALALFVGSTVIETSADDTPWSTSLFVPPDPVFRYLIVSISWRPHKCIVSSHTIQDIVAFAALNRVVACKALHIVGVVTFVYSNELCSICAKLMVRAAGKRKRSDDTISDMGRSPESRIHRYLNPPRTGSCDIDYKRVSFQTSRIIRLLG